jgi:hypothetical protein
VNFVINGWLCTPMAQRLGEIFLFHNSTKKVYSYAPAV